MKVICISGKAQHGKDTTASMMKKYLEKMDNRVLIIHYGDLLKYICKEIFEWDELKNEVGRQLLQCIGTDIVRKKKPDYWVDFVISILDLFDGFWEYVLIPDARFPNEVDLIKEKFDAIHVRVIRDNFESPLTEAQQQHPSEVSLDEDIPDYYIVNDSTLDDLEETVKTCIEEIVYAD